MPGVTAVTRNRQVRIASSGWDNSRPLLAQGHHLGRPVPAEEVAKIIAASNVPNQRGEGGRMLTVVPSAAGA